MSVRVNCFEFPEGEAVIVIPYGVPAVIAFLIACISEVYPNRSILIINFGGDPSSSLEYGPIPTSPICMLAL
jgi:hypothetical protein